MTAHEHLRTAMRHLTKALEYPESSGYALGEESRAAIRQCLAVLTELGEDIP